MGLYGYIGTAKPLSDEGIHLLCRTQQVLELWQRGRAGLFEDTGCAAWCCIKPCWLLKAWLQLKHLQRAWVWWTCVPGHLFMIGEEVELCGVESIFPCDFLVTKPNLCALFSSCISFHGCLILHFSLHRLSSFKWWYGCSNTGFLFSFTLMSVWWCHQMRRISEPKMKTCLLQPELEAEV